MRLFLFLVSVLASMSAVSPLIVPVAESLQPAEQTSRPPRDLHIILDAEIPKALAVGGLLGGDSRPCCAERQFESRKEDHSHSRDQALRK